MKYYLDIQNTEITEDILRFYINGISNVWLSKGIYVLDVNGREIRVDGSMSKTSEDLILKFCKKLDSVCRDFYVDSPVLKKHIRQLEDNKRKFSS